MSKLEKVIKGLKVHGDPQAECDECPYRNEESPEYGCLEELCNDALAMLKEDCHNCKLECLLQKYDELKEKYDALLKEQEETINELQNAYGYLQKQFFEAQDKLPKEQEAVVRCKDCKFWNDDGIITTCEKHIGNGYPGDWFCADGKRE